MDLSLEIDEDFKKTIEDFMEKPNYKSWSYKKCSGVNSGCLGLLTHRKSVLRPYLITINLPAKQVYKLNHKQKGNEWQYMKVGEQYRILIRYIHLLDALTEGYEMYFELTKNVNLHAHIITWYRGHLKDLRLETCRFFHIPPQNAYAVDVKEAYDLQRLRATKYLTEKKEKDYQTTDYDPIINHKSLKADDIKGIDIDAEIKNLENELLQ